MIVEGNKVAIMSRTSELWRHVMSISMPVHFTLKMEATWTTETVGILQQHYTASHPKRPRHETSPPWKKAIRL